MHKLADQAVKTDAKYNFQLSRAAAVEDEEHIVCGSSQLIAVKAKANLPVLTENF